ncbi:hypothetical protein BAY61_32435 (plasmid) [Prauserella marina]|uniref:Uncharacterized protein n=1 Tax=Prauserella marina TaxID=530584 RepID=A0A222W1I6_9PSEU|nr:hypothetical protein [Prauserella marina]ASR39990.1 hypothetical protein BAY61_32435 [Prauserella marina]PWV71330.1 hypothetical protein DES30_11246 [Prauserella marina]SDD96414.1 hypothetical protein SAMN05421630_11566 [Prauserella marina]
MTTSVEMIIGYDGDGRPHEVIVVDGRETEATYYELDPDDRRLRRGDPAEWLCQQELRAAAATPAAAAWIRRWAAQTAQHGEIELDGVADWAD